MDYELMSCFLKVHRKPKGIHISQESMQKRDWRNLTWPTVHIRHSIMPIAICWNCQKKIMDTGWSNSSQEFGWEIVIFKDHKTYNSLWCWILWVYIWNPERISLACYERSLRHIKSTLLMAHS